MMHSVEPTIYVVFFIALLLSVGVALIRVSKKVSGGRARTCNYEKIPFLSPAERSFFGVLEQAVANQFRIFAKVRLADIVRPKGDLSRTAWRSSFNAIVGKHVDFVLCHPNSVEVLAVIELDDRSHNRTERGARDALVDAIIETARVPVLRFTAKSAYSPRDINERIHEALAQDATAGKPDISWKSKVARAASVANARR